VVLQATNSSACFELIWLFIFKLMVQLHSAFLKCLPSTTCDSSYLWPASIPIEHWFSSCLGKQFGQIVATTEHEQTTVIAEIDYSQTEKIRCLPPSPFTPLYMYQYTAACIYMNVVGNLSMECTQWLPWSSNDTMLFPKNAWKRVAVAFGK
jgi:hypothetical protein